MCDACVRDHQEALKTNPDAMQPSCAACPTYKRDEEYGQILDTFFIRNKWRDELHDDVVSEPDADRVCETDESEREIANTYINSSYSTTYECDEEELRILDTYFNSNKWRDDVVSDEYTDIVCEPDESEREIVNTYINSNKWRNELRDDVVTDIVCETNESEREIANTNSSYSMTIDASTASSTSCGSGA